MIAALPLAAKIGLPIGAVVLSIAGYLFWQEYQQSVGRAEAEAEHLAELMQQQQEAMGHYIVSASLKLRTVERAVAEKDRVHARLRESYQEVVAHEQRDAMELPALERPACAVSPDLVRTVNGLARVLDDVATQRPSASGGAAGEPPGSRGGSAAGPDRGRDGGGPRQTDSRADGQTGEPYH